MTARTDPNGAPGKENESVEAVDRYERNEAVRQTSDVETRRQVLAEMRQDGYFLRPIAHVLDGIFVEDGPNHAAIGECLVRFEESAPLLRALLERAAEDGYATEEEAEQLFVGLHILGGGRDPASFVPLLRLLRRPKEELDRLLEDAATETLPRIVAGVFDGNADALFDAIADRRIDEFIRFGLLGTLAFLTWDGRIDREATIRFLERFDDESLAEPEDAAWTGWSEAVALLGLRSLVPRVKRAWEDRRIDQLMDNDFEEWAEALARTEADPNDEERFHHAGFSYIEDVAAELEWSGGADLGEMEPDSVYTDWDVLSEPAVNEWRGVGRNDPCPCGSGKKFKKCCLGKGR